MTGHQFAIDTAQFCIFIVICLLAAISLWAFVGACLCALFGIKVLWIW